MIVLLVGGCSSATGPVVVRPIKLKSDAGPVRGYVAAVDLTDPSVEIVVTSPAVLFNTAIGEAETHLEPTPDWARRHRLTLAINANYFRRIGEDAGGGGVALADVIGLCIANGAVVSPPRFVDGEAGPALVIDDRNRARITARPDLDRARFAVAGVGPSESEPALGGLLVTAGANTGATHRVDPLARHPRTAVGVDQAGQTLWLVVIDGRQPGWSVGMTLPELADLMIGYGAYDAVNLDGGGSSSFYFQPPDPQRTSRSRTITNRPSDGVHRGVGCHLGVRLIALD